MSFNTVCHSTKNAKQSAHPNGVTVKKRTCKSYGFLQSTKFLEICDLHLKYSNKQRVYTRHARIPKVGRDEWLI